MTNNTNEENLRDKIEEYVNEKGWPGFFGLLATISPHKMDQADLKAYNEEVEKKVAREEILQDEETKLSDTVEQVVQEASIYAPEHVSAVQDDLREQGLVPKQAANVINEPKKKVREPQKSSAPNPWGDAEIVSPGQLNL